MKVINVIKTREQALRVQNSRYNKGLKGTSKAVRRFVMRDSKYKILEYLIKMEEYPSDFDRCKL